MNVDMKFKHTKDVDLAATVAVFFAEATENDGSNNSDNKHNIPEM